MSDKTGIAWTDHTFNPWWGCTKVSPGCDHCYAERDANRYSPHVALWGVDAARRVFADKHWQGPLRWNTTARKDGRRHRVFCASMADVFDNHEIAEATRPRLWKLIRDTPYLDWQTLTKRIGNAKRMLPADWGDGYPNVWLGASVVNQEECERDIPRLMAVSASVRFLSCEPLLDAIDLAPFLDRGAYYYGQHEFEIPDWVIVGGESGPKARPFNIQWARGIRDQCKAAGVAFFMKQTGSDHALLYERVQKNRAGADPLEWPEDLRVQEWPAVTAPPTSRKYPETLADPAATY